MTKKELEIENQVLKYRLELIDKLLQAPRYGDEKSYILGVCMFLAEDNDKLEYYKEYPERMKDMYSPITDNPKYKDIFHPEVQS